MNERKLTLWARAVDNVIVIHGTTQATDLDTVDTLPEDQLDVVARDARGLASHLGG